MADMFPGFDEVSRPLLLRCASFMMENVFSDIKDVANFTSRCSEEGHTSAALKLLNIIKDLSEKHPGSPKQAISKVQPFEPASSSTGQHPTTNNKQQKRKEMFFQALSFYSYCLIKVLLPPRIFGAKIFLDPRFLLTHFFHQNILDKFFFGPNIFYPN